MSKEVLKCFSQNKSRWLSLLVLSVGTVVWSLTMVRSGLNYSFGIGFWGPNAHDGVWHLSLAQGLSRFNLGLPIFAGEKIVNYHIGFDLLLALVHRISFIPISVLYFQIFPPLFAFLIGFLTCKLVGEWTKSYRTAVWSLFLVYFGGNFAYIITLARGEGLSGESMFWAQPSTSTLLNPPHALSLIVILLGIYYLNKYYRSNEKRYLIFSSLLFGILAQIKIYAAVLALGGLFVISFWQLFSHRRKTFLRVFLLSLVIGLLVSLPFIKSEKLVGFAPFWMIETMFAFGDRVYWPKMYEAMINYKASFNLLKGTAAYLFAFAVFVLGNLGVRLVFLAEFKNIKRDIKEFNWLTVFFYLIVILGFIFPNIIVQKGTPWNSIQFSYYSIFFASLLAAKFLANLKVNKYLLTLGILILAAPTTLSSLKHYLPKYPQAKLPREEVFALEFLKAKEDGTVLKASIYNPDLIKPEAPIPLYLYDSTAYVSAYSGKDVYLEDTVNLNILGYDVKEREDKLREFLSNPNSQGGIDFLKSNKIRYIYRLKVISQVSLDEEYLGLANIFDNSKVTIYEVVR
jgi:hypothetical protein